MKWKESFTDFTMYFVSFVGITVSVYFIYFGDSIKRSTNTEQLGEITEFKNSIKVRPKGAFEWFEASHFYKNEVFESDYLFSGESSTAEIRTQAGDVIKINPNSMIFLKKGENSKIDILVYDGDLDYKASTGEVVKVKKSQSLTVSKNIKRAGENSVKLQIAEIKKEPPFKAQPVAIDIKESPVLSLIEPVTPPVVAPEIVPDKVEIVEKDRWEWRPENRVKIELKLATASKRFLGEPSQLLVTWPKTFEATEYKIEISKPSAKKVILTRKTSDPILSIPWMTPGSFRVTVLKYKLLSKRDLSSQPERQKSFDFVVDPIEETAGLKTVFPRPNQLIILKSQKTSVYLKWIKSNGFSEYVVELSRNKEFKGPKNQEIVPNTKLEKSVDVSKLQSGVWFWRVKGLSETKESQWSTANKFNLVK